jgi:hypothetical protein
MTQPLSRDDLARHLYIHNHDSHGAAQWERDKWAKAWDSGEAFTTDGQNVDFCYARADEMIAEGAVR